MLVLLGLLDHYWKSSKLLKPQNLKVDSNPPIGIRRARGQGSSEP